MKFKHLTFITATFIILLLSAPRIRANPILIPDYSKIISNFIINIIVIYLITGNCEFIIIYASLKFIPIRNEIISHKLYFAVLFINAITFIPTQIYAWFFYFKLPSFFIMYIIIAEILVVYIEYLLLLDKLKGKALKFSAFKQVNRKHIVIITVIANFGSFYIGFMQFGLWPPIFYQWPLYLIFV